MARRPTVSDEAIEVAAWRGEGVVADGNGSTDYGNAIFLHLLVLNSF